MAESSGQGGRVLELKYVHFHPGNGNPEKQADAITDELNRWVADGWRVFKVLRPALIGPVNLVLERDVDRPAS